MPLYFDTDTVSANNYNTQARRPANECSEAAHHARVDRADVPALRVPDRVRGKPALARRGNPLSCRSLRWRVA